MLPHIYTPHSVPATSMGIAPDQQQPVQYPYVVMPYSMVGPAQATAPAAGSVFYGPPPPLNTIAALPQPWHSTQSLGVAVNVSDAVHAPPPPPPPPPPYSQHAHQQQQQLFHGSACPSSALSSVHQERSNNASCINIDAGGGGGSGGRVPYEITAASLATRPHTTAAPTATAMLASGHAPGVVYQAMAVATPMSSDATTTPPYQHAVYANPNHYYHYTQQQQQHQQQQQQQLSLPPMGPLMVAAGGPHGAFLHTAQDQTGQLTYVSSDSLMPLSLAAATANAASPHSSVGAQSVYLVHQPPMHHHYPPQLQPPPQHLQQTTYVLLPAGHPSSAPSATYASSPLMPAFTALQPSPSALSPQHLAHLNHMPTPVTHSGGGELARERRTPPDLCSSGSSGVKGEREHASATGVAAAASSPSMKGKGTAVFSTEASGVSGGKAKMGGPVTTVPVMQGTSYAEDPVEIDTTKRQLIVNYLPQRLTNEQFRDLFRPYGELMEEESHIIFDLRHRKPPASLAPADDGTPAPLLSSGAPAAGVGSSAGAESTAPTAATTTTTPTTTASGVPRSKGYGFIYYCDGASTERAIKELNGREVDGKRIKVRYAEQQRSNDVDAAASSTCEAVASVSGDDAVSTTAPES